MDPPLNHTGTLAHDGERLFMPICDLDLTGFLELDELSCGLHSLQGVLPHLALG